MKIEMKKINYKIILGILLLVALVGAVLLVQQKQETRRGATSSVGFIRLSLEESSTTKQVTAGQEFTVPIVANVTGAGGVDSMVAYFCYDPTKIELKNVSDLEKSFTLVDPARYVGGSIKVEESNNKCIKVTFVSIKQGKRMEAKVVDINFKTVANSGTGTITIDKSKSSLGVAGQDTVAIDSVGNLNYSIGGSVGDCTPTSNNPTGCSSNYGCMKIDGNYKSIDGDCKNPVKDGSVGSVKYVSDPSCPPISDAVLATLGSSGNNDACGAVSTVVNGNCSTSRNTCTSGELDDIEDSDTEYKWNCVGTNGGTTDNCSKTKSAGDAVVDIKLAFAGVKKDNGKCAVNWPVTVKVLNNAGVNVLDDTFSATPTQTTSVNSKGEIIYDYNVTVSNVPTAGVGNLAFFLTGSKHISVKYGENNQKAWFSNLAGSLSLTRGETSSYDFSEYPLTTGDVNGDGKINGQDYSYIKEKANVLTSGNTGTSVDGDINGDCQVNSGDIALIKKSLKEVNGQTY